jgi:GNAT superfamily N-acetyltransferase
VTPAPFDDYPRTVVLKDGTHVALRPVSGADRTGLPFPLEATAAAAVIVAVDGDRVVGASVLERRGEVGTVRVHVAPDHHGRRLGTWMLLDAVHLAAALGIARLEAHAAPDETAYRDALDRLDFVEQSPGVLVKTLHATWPDF